MKRSPIRPILRTLAIGTAAFAVVGTAYVAFVTHRATATLSALMAEPLWEHTGRVYSAPMELWPGMQISPEALEQDLIAAGYTASAQAPAAPMSFQKKGRTFSIQGADGETSTVAFSDTGIASTEPGPMLRLAPVELAEQRGPENVSQRAVVLDELPPHVWQAVLAMEDARFFDHSGVDIFAVARAAVANAAAGEITQGGSTLSQQLVKNLFLSADRTYRRKAREAVLSVALERTATKEEILEMYLNMVYLGQVNGAAISGVEQAARSYFGKPAERLTLGEAAMLGGIISAPNRYSPWRHPEAALERRRLVLDRMVEQEWITPSEADAAATQPLSVPPTPLQHQAPWAVEHAIEQVEAHFEEDGIVAGQGWTVHTTIQPALQHIAEEAVADTLAVLDPGEPELQAAFVVMRASDGAILAMVGGRDFTESPFNRATDAQRQLGSTVKPLTYLAAFVDGRLTSTGERIEDEPLVIGTRDDAWAPENYDHSYRGAISVREALQDSRNVPAVRVAQEVGFSRLQDWARTLGLDNATALPSAALGSFEVSPLSLASAYTIFPGEGTQSSPRLVGQVFDEDAELWAPEPTLDRRAAAAPTWMVTSMLASVVDSGTGAGIRRFGVRAPAGGKTGTTDNGRDAWFVGFTGDIVAVAWVGYDEGADLGRTGSQAALPIWARFMARSNFSGGLPEKPSGVSTVELCSDSLDPVSCRLYCEPRTEYALGMFSPECTNDLFGMVPRIQPRDKGRRLFWRN